MSDTKDQRSRGFAGLSQEQRREIAARGARTAHERGTAYEWTSEEAKAAGRKGGNIAATRPQKAKEERKMNIPDFDELIEAAKRLRYDGDPEHVMDRLWQIIVRNQNYLDRRVRQSQTGAFNQTVAEDSVAIAAAIKMIKEKQ